MRKFAYTLLIVLTLLLIIEGLLALIGAPPRTHDSRFVLNPEWDYPEFIAKDHDLFWRFRPNRVIESAFFARGRYTVNSHGFRTPEYTIPKERGIRRIVCLGNSCTFGWKVADSSTYPRVLGAMISTKGPWEVINAGVTGYSSLQGLRLLRRNIEDWQPDVVTICYGWNDHWRAAWGVADAELKLPPKAIVELQNALAVTYTYRWLKYVLRGVVGKGSPQLPQSAVEVVYRVPPADYARNIEEMVDLCHTKGAEVILITAPIGDIDPANVGKLFSPAMAQFHDRYNDVMRAIADRDTLLLVDAAATFSERAPARVFDDPRDDPIHYNSQGHNLLAELLVKKLTELPELRTRP